MRDRTKLSEHELTGSPNVRRELKRRLASDGDPSKYGSPPVPDGMDEAETKAWNALVAEYGDRLYVTDGPKLLQIARTDVLIDQAYRAAKKGATRGGKRNPAFVQIAQMTKVRMQLVKQIEGRAPRRTGADRKGSFARFISKPEEAVEIASQVSVTDGNSLPN